MNQRPDDDRAGDLIAHLPLAGAGIRADDGLARHVLRRLVRRLVVGMAELSIPSAGARSDPKRNRVRLASATFYGAREGLLLHFDQIDEAIDVNRSALELVRVSAQGRVGELAAELGAELVAIPPFWDVVGPSH